MSNNTPKINTEQRERLLDLVENNKKLLLGKTRGNVLKNQVWCDIASVLNKLGPEKTMDQWKKTWTDIKSFVMKKAREVSDIENNCGTHLRSDVKLSEEDYQVLRMCDIHIMDNIADTYGHRSMMRMNSAQRQSMLQLIEENISILYGPNSTEKRAKWSMIAVTLNKLGPKKSEELWRKAWVELKKSVKRKVTYGEDSGDLTEDDLRVIRIYETEAKAYPQGMEELAGAMMDEVSMKSNELQLQNSTIGSDSSVISLSETSQNHIEIEMENLKSMSHTNNVINFQKTLRTDLQTCDITLAFKNKSVRAHRFVLSASSTLLRELLKDIPVEHEATIVVPDIDGNLLESILNFIYMGETNISSTRLTEFIEAIGSLGIKSSISFECSNVSITSKEAPEGAAIEQVEVEDELKQETIDIDDEEDFSIVEHAILNQQNVIVDNLDEIMGSFETNVKTHTEHCRSRTPTEYVETGDTEVSALAEHLDMDSPMEEVNIDDPISECIQNQRPKRLRNESSDNEVTNKIYKPHTYLEKVNRLKAEQKQSLETAFSAHIQGGMTLQKAAIKYNVSRAKLIRRVATYQILKSSLTKNTKKYS